MKLLQQNIGKAGRVIRAVFGLILLGIAIWINDVQSVRSVGLAIAGVFCLLQAKRGWCIARACGVKTPW